VVSFVLYIHKYTDIPQTNMDICILCYVKDPDPSGGKYLVTGEVIHLPVKFCTSYLNEQVLVE
jgi:hypothetical protein